jgi:glycoprotein endo-alpha-1,2-mannosidase
MLRSRIVRLLPSTCLACLILVMHAACGAADPTSLPTPTTRPVPVVARLALVSDPHVSPDPRYEAYVKNFERVITDVNAASVDAVLLSGDLAQTGNPESFARFKELAARFSARTWPVAGNHDVGQKPLADKPATVTEQRVAQFEEIVGPAFFAADVAPGVRVLGITSSLLDTGLPREQAQWEFLERELARPRDAGPTPTRTFLLTHYPPFAAKPDEADEYFNINTSARGRLGSLLKRGGVAAILSGHLHRPIERDWDGGVRVIGAPAVSFGLPHGLQDVGWKLVTLHADGSITTELHYLKNPAMAPRDPASVPATAAAATAPAAAASTAPSLSSLGPLAVLPLASADNHVFEYLKHKGLSDQLHLLRGEDVIDPERFSATKYKVALYLGGEQYQRSVNEPADVDLALRLFTAAGGVLAVLSTGPYPFYQDEQGTDVIAGPQFGLVFLGNGEQEESAFGFDEPPKDAGLSFVARGGLAGRPERLAFPAATPEDPDRRWRPLVRTAQNAAYEPLISLVDRDGKRLGDAAAWAEKVAAKGAKPARVLYASYLLTQRHPQRDAVLDALFAKLAEKVNAPAAGGAGAEAAADVSDGAHIFYYNWYGAPPHQREYVHWPQGGHRPPDAIGANYCPLLGPYSSSDPDVLKRHMQWIRQAGVGVLTLSWWGRDSYEDRGAHAVLDAAAAAGLKVNFHLEPYDGSTPDRFADDVAYILTRYGRHPAFYRTGESLGRRPMFYVFESLRHPPETWRPALERLRASAGEPVLMIGQTSDLSLITAAGFDGGYTYDVLAPFKNPQMVRDWPAVAREFAGAGKLFIPSVGPGYWDDRAVPRGADEPDAARTRDRGAATTYAAMWRAAIDAGGPIVTITSFNEWHEGSQIEPAVPKESAEGYRYPGYAGGETEYLRRTADAVAGFEAARRQRKR